AFEKKTFPGSEVVFWIYVATMMVPGQVTLIPLYGIMRDLGLLNTHIALALPVVNAFGVFLIRQFMKGIPDDLLDAARIDGASDFRIFVRIILPLVKPVIIALTVFTFLTTWNDFLWPLVSITEAEMETVTLAAANLQGRFTTDYALGMAGGTVACPVRLILHVVLQHQLVECVVASGVECGRPVQALMRQAEHVTREGSDLSCHQAAPPTCRGVECSSSRPESSIAPLTRPVLRWRHTGREVVQRMNSSWTCEVARR